LAITIAVNQSIVSSLNRSLHSAEWKSVESGCMWRWQHWWINL